MKTTVIKTLEAAKAAVNQAIGMYEEQPESQENSKLLIDLDRIFMRLNNSMKTQLQGLLVGLVLIFAPVAAAIPIWVLERIF